MQVYTDGKVTGGSLGEASTLFFDEKLEVTRIALNMANNRIPVLANVSETRKTNALRFVEQVAQMDQNLKLVEPMVGVGNEFVRRPSQHIVGAERERVSAFLARAEIRDALQAQGVSPEATTERVQAMSDAEVAQLAGRIDQAPAGGDILGVLFTIFIVLLVTDILGLTKVFPFTRSVR